MPNNPLFYPIQEQRQTSSLQDQVQIALAIADHTLLKSLLVNCIPAISQPHLIGSVAVELAVPVRDRYVADGILHYEALKCVLAAPQDGIERSQAYDSGNRSDQWRHKQFESELHTLDKAISLTDAVSLLTHAGFSPEQVKEILYLPYEGWYKSWWYTLDENENFTVPFLRLIRTLRYPDGTFAIQYKDYYEQDQPPCFSSMPQKVKLRIRTEDHGFGETLGRINTTRTSLGITQTILICNTIAELEAQGFISQGISIYPAAELVLPTRANCTICGTKTCPMNGTEDSPIMMCRRFSLEAEFA